MTGKSRGTKIITGALVVLTAIVAFGTARTGLNKATDLTIARSHRLGIIRLAPVVAATTICKGGEEIHGENDDLESYASGTPLVRIFGDTPRVRIVAAVLSEPHETLDAGDIAQLSGVKETKVTQLLPALDRVGVVECDGVRERPIKCELNTANPAVDHLRKAELGQVAYDRSISE